MNVALQSEFSTNRNAGRIKTLETIIRWLLVILFFRVIASILFEYRHYFPANFESNFLAGRKASFVGWYRIAFYMHIISGPPCLLIAAFQMFSGNKKRFGHWHRSLGKTLAVLALLVMLPSGLVMASRSFAGPIAGFGFAALTLATAGSIVMAAWHARAGRIAIHQLWARRSFVLLCSPLLLRLFGGAMYVSGLESDWTYRFAAWGSWLIPLVIFELIRLTNFRPIANHLKGA